MEDISDDTVRKLALSFVWTYLQLSLIFLLFFGYGFNWILLVFTVYLKRFYVGFGWLGLDLISVLTTVAGQICFLFFT
jgi:hypothetical protein